MNADGEEKEVCMQAFISQRDVTFKRVYCLSEVKPESKGCRDLRGTAPTSSHNVMSGQYLQRIREFVESFTTRHVHYSNNSLILSSAILNFKMLPGVFIKKHPDIDDQVIKFDLFYCKQTSSLSFGRAQMDVCSICE
jgi:hypothetical protein